MTKPKNMMKGLILRKFTEGDLEAYFKFLKVPM